MNLSLMEITDISKSHTYGCYRHLKISFMFIRTLKLQYLLDLLLELVRYC